MEGSTSPGWIDPRHLALFVDEDLEHDRSALPAFQGPRGVLGLDALQPRLLGDLVLARVCVVGQVPDVGDVLHVPHVVAQVLGGAAAAGVLGELATIAWREVAGLVLVASVAVTIGDFVFKSEVARHVAPEDLARFYPTSVMVTALPCVRPATNSP